MHALTDFLSLSFIGFRMDLQNQKRNLEKVTDYVEEKEIDRSKVQNLDLKEEDEVDSELDKQQ